MEEVLRRTFAEYRWFKQKNQFEDEYEKLIVERRTLPKLECETCATDIFNYHTALETFWFQWADFMWRLIMERNASKLFSPGRFMLCHYANIDTKTNGPNHFDIRLCFYLNCHNNSGQITIRALVLKPVDSKDGPSTNVPVSTLFPNILACPTTSFTLEPLKGLVDSVENGLLKLQVVDNLKPMDINSFFNQKQIKLPPGSNTSFHQRALNDCQTEMLQLLRVMAKPNFEWNSLLQHNIDPLKCSTIVQFSNLQLPSDAAQIQAARQDLASSFVCRTCPQFAEHIKVVHNVQLVANRISKIRHHLSAASLTLGPEYQAIVEVLHEMGFIDK